MLTVIEPKSGWRLVEWRELREYQDLLYFLVWRDIKVLYKQTVFGFAWAIIRPVSSMIVFSAIFGNLADIPSDGVPYPIFAYAALLPWTYFSGAMAASTQSLVGNSGLLTKVYFPRILIPLTPVIAKLVDFGIAFVILALLMVWYQTVPNLNIVFIPILLGLLILTASGIGMWLSALAIQYRDVKFAMSFVTQLLMYAAPVVWPATLIPQQFRLLYGLYPMAGIIEGFRAALLSSVAMPWDLILMGTISSVTLTVSGILYFHRMERIFADVA